MKKNYFNFKKFEDSILITNDFGQYAFLRENEFRRLMEDALPEEASLTKELEDKLFIYDDSELDYSARVSGMLLRNKGYLTAATSLHIFVVTTACNLRCIYCQANKGTGASTLFMTEEIAARAVDIALESPEERLDFEFQGGEPLANFPVIKYIVEYAETRRGSREIRYSLVSNLTLLTDEIIDFIRKYHISVSTSLDGGSLVHDHNRPFADGSGSFARARAGVDRLRENGIFVGAIETTTRFSLGYPKEITDAYKDLGFNSIFLRPLTPLGRAEKNWGRIGYTAEEYLEFYTAAMKEILRLNREGFPLRESHAAIFLKRIFGRAVNYMELRSPCGGGVGQIAYYADGNVFTCDEGRMLYEMGDGAFRLGNVFENEYRELIRNSVCRTVVQSSILETIPGCADCVYQPYCGVCPVVNYAACGDVIEKEPRGYKCRIYMGMLELLFHLLKENKEDVVDILKSWGK